MVCRSMWAHRVAGWFAAAMALTLFAWAGPARADDPEPTVAQRRGGGFVYRAPPREGETAGDEFKLYKRALAVVIGINAYEHISPLNGAVRDAKRMAEVLKSQGFEVTEIYDAEATKKNITRVLGDQLARKANEDDAILIFFAGHGVTTDPDRPEVAMGYLMPIEGERDNPISSGVSMTEMQNWFGRYRSRHVMFVADACYTGLALSTRAIGLSPEMRDYVRMVAAKPVRFSLTAGGAGEEAIETGEGGLFTTAFIEAINGSADVNRDGLITSDEISAYVRPTVSQTAMREFRASQNPQSGRRGEGEFLFLNPNGAVTKAKEIALAPATTVAPVREAAAAQTKQVEAVAVKKSVSEDDTNKVRARPWVFLGTGVAMLGVGGAFHGLNMSRSISGFDANGNALSSGLSPKVTGAVAIAGYAVGGGLVVGAIIDWAVNGYREKSDVAAIPLPTGTDKLALGLNVGGGNAEIVGRW
jgi:uncharacterized caspase-like protein